LEEEEGQHDGRQGEEAQEEEGDGPGGVDRKVTVQKVGNIMGGVVPQPEQYPLNFSAKIRVTGEPLPEPVVGIHGGIPVAVAAQPVV